MDVSITESYTIITIEYFKNLIERKIPLKEIDFICNKMAVILTYNNIRFGLLNNLQNTGSFHLLVSRLNKKAIQTKHMLKKDF